MMTSLLLAAALLVGERTVLWGVNYYAPFSLDYISLKEDGADIRTVMREDVAHFRRLGVDLLRVHCFDRQISDAEGRFLDNEHVALMDELMALCASNGIRTVLTPIAWWWCGHDSADKTGFSATHDMRTLTRERALWQVQARYLGEFAAHTNRFTGFRYADDPCVHAFELVNEPLYDADYPDEKLTEYVNTLAAGLRASGTKKPVFFNSWCERNAAVEKAAVDGATANIYPTGLVGNEELEGSQLATVTRTTLCPEKFSRPIRKMVYEFEAADTPGSYMYPAMARLFRHEGMEAAALFQYDPMRLADRNADWQTHHFNLVYTPAKAISFLIAGEAFRSLPEGCPFETNAVRMAFGPFLVDAERDLSQMVTERDYLYSNDPVSPPPDPVKLVRVYGCGASSVAASTGTGAYFLDRLSSGRWRLQLYPSVFRIENPYRGGKSKKVVALAEEPSFTVDLPDLGPKTTWRLAPGDYLLQAKDGRVACVPFPGGEPFPLPKFDPPRPYAYLKTSEGQCRCDRPVSVRTEFTGTNRLDLVLTAEKGAVRKTLPTVSPRTEIPADFLTPGVWNLSLLDRPVTETLEQRLDGRLEVVARAEDWNLLDVRRLIWRKPFFPKGGWRRAVPGPGGALACRFEIANLADEPAVTVKPRTDGDFRAAFPEAGEPKALVVTCRRGERHTGKVEVVVLLKNGQPWGTVIDVPETWGEVTIPVGQLRFFSHWKPSCAYREGDHPDLRDIASFSFCFGRWILPKEIHTRHNAVDLAAVRLAFCNASAVVHTRHLRIGHRFDILRGNSSTVGELKRTNRGLHPTVKAD